MDDEGQGGFRASANDDPHGTRAIATTLSAQDKTNLAADRTPERWVGALGLAMVVALFSWLMLTNVEALRALELALVPVPAIGGLVAAGFVTRRQHRMMPEKTGLKVTDGRGRERTLRWAQIESFEISRMTRVTVRARIDGATEVLVGTTAPVAGSLVAREAALLIPSTERELARNARATIAVVLGGAGIAFFAIAALIARTEFGGRSALGGILLAALLYAVITAWWILRTRLTAKRDGLHLPGRVIPWHTIEGAAPRARSANQQVRIYLEGNDEVSVFCGDADRAVAEIMERRDVARRMRAEKK